MDDDLDWKTQDKNYGCHSLISREYRKAKNNADTTDKGSPKEKSETNTEHENASDEDKNVENREHSTLGRVSKWYKKKVKQLSTTFKHHSKEKQDKKRAVNGVEPIKIDAESNQENLPHREEVRPSTHERVSEVRDLEPATTLVQAENGNAEDL